MKVKKLTFMAVLLAAALTVFVAEAQLPPPVPIPGVKLGLANIVTLAAIVWLGRKEAAAVLFLRIIIGSIFAGQAVSFIYSAAGGLVCFCVMSAVFPLMGKERLWAVSVLGAVGHNVGQIAAAAFVMSVWQVVVYLPVLIASGIITGAFTGLAAQLVIKRVRIDGKDFK